MAKTFNDIADKLERRSKAAEPWDTKEETEAKMGEAAVEGEQEAVGRVKELEEENAKLLTKVGLLQRNVASLMKA